MNDPRGHARKHSLICAASMFCVMCLPPGTAAAAPDGSNHAMGSQIRAHEAGRSSTARPTTGTVSGIDVSSYQTTVDWAGQRQGGARFAYVKATESNDYTNPLFSQQTSGARNAGMLVGAYHFAQPGSSSGSDQANYFLDHGGDWSGDGKTLPGALDVEYNPDGDTCYNLSPSDMADWIRDFSDTYYERTQRYPVIYTSTRWWNQCVDGQFSSTNPLWVASYADTMGPLPRGWDFQTFWQYSSSPLDQDKFNGGYDRLRVLARG